MPLTFGQMNPIQYTLGVALISLLVSSVSANESKAAVPFNKVLADLASAEGFSDDDAIKASFVFLEFLIGAKQEGQKKVSRIVLSEPAKIRVFVCYDIGLKFFGYEFEYQRGDLKKGMKWAHFTTLQHIPSE